MRREVRHKIEMRHYGVKIKKKKHIIGIISKKNKKEILLFSTCMGGIQR